MILLLVLTPGVPVGASAGPGASRLSWLDEACPTEFALQAVVHGLDVGRSARILFHHRPDGRCLALDVETGRLVLSRRQQGRSQVLAASPLRVGSGPLELTIQRRLWRIRVLCGPRIVARAYDSDSTGGRAGWRASAGVSVDLRMQATEPATFADDFTRSGGEPGPWDVLAGRFAVSEVAAGSHDGAVGRYSSNAFSWVAHPRPIALCAAGHWFWSDYAVSASVRSEGPGWVGLAACLKDARTYILFRWRSAAPGHPRSGVCQLVRVDGGGEKVLASRAGGFQPRQWYRLGLEVYDGHLVATIDEEPVCSARDSAYGQGRIGLYAEESPRVTFDDVWVCPADGMEESFGAGEPGKWLDSGVAWRTRPQAHERCTVQAGAGVTVAGRPDWGEGVLEAEVVPGAASRVGLCYGWARPGHYSLFWVPAGPGERAWLVRFMGGKVEELARSAVAVRAGRQAHLRLDRRNGVVRGYLDGRLVVEGVDLRGMSGRLGFYAAGASGAAFRRATARFTLWPRPAPTGEGQFAREETMAAWADPRRSWGSDGTGTWWHTSDFFTDPAIWLDLPPGSAPFSGSLVVSGTPGSAGSGYQLAVRLEESEKVRLELAREGKVVATDTGPWETSGLARRLRLWREGSLVAGSLGQAAAVWFRDPRPVNGSRVGIRVLDSGAVPAMPQVASAHWLDCSFTGPPTEWWSARGTWDVVQRWPCDMRWSFFGGLQSESPMLWTKRTYAGDMTVEAWVALYMDAPEDPVVGYRHPGDLNLTLCGDGRDLSSGYSFLFAAANNTVTRILRRDQVVVENPGLRMLSPVRTNLQFQRHWYHLRAERRGRRIRFLVDGVLAGEYEDPDPIPGGRVALWTWRNGLMVAHVRISAERGGGAALPFVPAIQPAPLTTTPWQAVAKPGVVLRTGFEEGTAGWAPEPSEEAPVLVLDRSTRVEGMRSLRVVNRVSGGDLGVFCGVQRFDAARFPFLRFACRMDPEAKVNLYLRTRGRLVAVGLSAPTLQEAGVPLLGAVEGFRADGQWHHVQVPLLALLRKAFPGEQSLPVEDLCLRAPQVEYLRSGFGGNTWGCSYHLDDFRLVADGKTRAADLQRLVEMRGGPARKPASGRVVEARGSRRIRPLGRLGDRS